MEFPAFEDSFRREHLPLDRRQAHWVALGCSLVLAPFVVEDARLYGGTSLFWALAATRGGLLLSAVALVAALRRVTEPQHFDRLMAAWGAFFVLADLMLVATRPGHHAAHLAVHVVMVMILYLAIPLPLRLQTAFAVAWSLGYLVAVSGPLGFTTPNARFAALGGLLIANVLGYATSRRHHLASRRLYVSRERLRRLQQQTEQDALTDPLTQLYNRRGWVRHLEAEEEHCRRDGVAAAVISLDLDSLKAVNDREGHAAGDLLLLRTAECLRRVVRQPDVVARVGGDEFLVLATGCDGARAGRLTERLEDALEAAGIAASVAFASREDHDDLEGTWETADQAMYRRKRFRQEQRPSLHQVS